MYPAVQLIIIIICSVGCLVSLFSAARSFVASLRRAVQEIPFLTPVSASACACNRVPQFFGLLQVRHLAEQMPEAQQEDAKEVQI